MKATYRRCKRSSHPPRQTILLFPVLKALSLTGFAFAIAQLPASAQEATTVGWWQEGSNPPVVVEQLGGSTLELIVRRAGDGNVAFTVDWETTATGTATPGSDFQASGGALTFAPGENEKTVQVPILDDGLLEFPEEHYCVVDF